MNLCHFNSYDNLRHRSIAAVSGSTFKNENMCHNLKGLNRKQIRVCKRNVELMTSVKEGAEMAIRECQHQFKYRKWNCTTINKKNEPVFGNALNKGKDSSFTFDFYKFPDEQTSIEIFKVFSVDFKYSRRFDVA
jgi:Na+-transporting NADH:ubiquinone oxidoreductase subunit NqrF